MTHPDTFSSEAIFAILQNHKIWRESNGTKGIRAYLTRADLTDIKHDLLEAIKALPDEVPNLRKALIGGRVDGSAYEGQCACLAGTIANHRGIKYQELTELNFPVDSNSPRERFFLAIRPGDTPETNPVSAIVVSWLDEFLAANLLSP